MIDIVPNLHPALVHFPVALAATSALFALAGKLAGGRPVAAAWIATSRWTLWLAAATGVAAVLAGMHAFSTVDHDDAGHAAMLRHRSAALLSLGLLLMIALREAYCSWRGRAWTWLTVLLIAGVTVAVGRTAALGGELVYRHGIGVLPRPAAATASRPPPSPPASAPPAAAPTAPPAAATPSAKAAHDHPGHKHSH